MSAPDADADSTLDLSGPWRAGLADEELRRTWYGDRFDDSGFTDIDVPGHWRRSSAFTDNDEPLLYRRRFSTVSARDHTRAWLVLDGVCAQGDVWLDESYLGNTDGAWVPHRFEVTDALAARNDHVIGIEVTSPPLGDRSSKKGLLGALQDGPYVVPGWNPGGIWRPVTIRRTGPVAITAHRVLCTAATATRAVVTITCTLDSVTAGQVTIRTVVDGVDHERHQPLARGTNTVSWDVTVPDPALWWPAELGDQPLVEVTVEVSEPTGPDTEIGRGAERAPDSEPSDGGGTTASDDEEFRRSDSFATRCGLRDVTLRDWILTVNGERLFVRGLLSGPAAHELATAPDDDVTAPVRAAFELGANLLRVHAHLAPDALYRAADEAGMLIWQDLPLYRGQNRSVRRTAIRTAQATVDRLGAHPSIVVWCGHDEPDHVIGGGGDDDSDRAPGFSRRLLAHQLPNWNRSVLDRSVKRALTGADASRPVIGSSGTWPHPPSLAGTDTHLDLGWSSGDPDDLVRIARAIPRAARFVQITPSPSPDAPPPARLEVQWPPDSVADVIGDLPVDPDVLAGRLPPAAFDSAEDWFRAMHNYQALLIRTQIETLRRLKYRPTGGFVIAHLSDLRPGLSPSLIDHTGSPKPAADALRAALAPVLATLSPWPGCAHPGDRIESDVHVISDVRSALVDLRCRVELRWTGGSAHWEFAGDLAADSVERIGHVELLVPTDVDRIDAHVRVTGDGVDRESRCTVPVHADDH